MCCFISKQILKKANCFHGHIGPFLVLGLKAGLFSNKTLGKDPFKNHVTVKTFPHPPYSCFVDGIQITTGCTMGKRNITLKTGKSLSVVFFNDKKRLELIIKTNILRYLEDNIENKYMKSTVLKIIDLPIQDIFDIKSKSMM
jgi:formylmethanofuran dehydrogenase subunit E